MKHCKDCKWRSAIQDADEFASCENPKLLATDYEGNTPYTLPDFGCVQFEPKESEPHERQR